MTAYLSRRSSKWITGSQGRSRDSGFRRPREGPLPGAWTRRSLPKTRRWSCLKMMARMAAPSAAVSRPAASGRLSTVPLSRPACRSATDGLHDLKVGLRAAFAGPRGEVAMVIAPVRGRRAKGSGTRARHRGRPRRTIPSAGPGRRQSAPRDARIRGSRITGSTGVSLRNSDGTHSNLGPGSSRIRSSPMTA
jgi:hypothetical protein